MSYGGGLYGGGLYEAAIVTPTLTAAVQQQTRVLLTLTWPGIQTATIQRLDPDGVLRNVRNAEPATCVGSCAAFDHEAPFDQAVTYRATSPQGSGTVLTDTYGRTVGAGSWGNADTGQTYTLSVAAACSVGSGVGKIQPNGTGTDFEAYIDIGSADFDMVFDASVGTLPASGTWGTGITGRLVDTSNYNTLRFEVTAAGAMTLRLTERVAGSTSNLATASLATTYVAATVYRLRLRCQGQHLQGKIWLASSGEPVAWNLDVTDPTPFAGTMAGAFARNDTAVTTHVMSYDNLTVNSLAPLTVTSNTVTSPSGGQAWLTHPGHPAYDGMATVTPDGLSEQRGSRRGVFVPIGASLPVVVNDVRSASNGILVVQTNSTRDTIRLRNLLADGAPLLLRQPLTWGGDAWWISIGDVDIDRFTRIATDNWRRWALPYQRVDRPPGTSDGALGLTYDDLKAAGYANYNALAATGKTYTQLAQSLT